MQMNRTLKGYLLTILSAVMFGFVPAVAKLGYACGFSPIGLTFFRNLTATLMLAVIVPATGEPLGIKDRSSLGKVCLLGLFCTTITPLLLYISYSFIPSGMATTFHFTYPALTILGTALVMHRPIHRSQVFCVLLCTIGIFLFYSPDGQIRLIGAATALLSGVTYTAYILLLDKFRLTGISALKATFYMTLVASVILFVVCLLTGNLSAPKSLAGVGVCILTALLSTVGATVLFQKGTLLLGGARSAILSTFEPITSVIVGILVFHDPFSFKTILGSVCVIAAAILIAVFDLRKEKR